MPGPGVTVVIPCYNHGRYVGDAVRAALAQEQADVRVVVVDDGSDDGTSAAACEACREQAPERVSVIRQENRGLAAARNRGAEGAATEYVVFLDADDWIEPAFVSRLYEAILAGGGASGPMPGAEGPWGHRGVSHAYCQERLVGLATGVWRVPEWDGTLLMVTNLHPVTALLRRECFQAVCGFDESMRQGYEDWDLWLRLAESGWRGVRVREPLFVWRRHSQSTMIVEAARRHDCLYRRLVENHPALYARHAGDVLVLTNTLLRRADASWLDEDGEAIVLRDTRARLAHLEQDRCTLVGERDRAREAIAQLQADARAQLEAQRAELERMRDEYENKPAVRLSRALHRTIGSMPRLVSAPAIALLRAIKKTAPSRRG